MLAPIAAAVALLAASPVQGSVFGPIVSVKGTTFTLTTSLSPTGKSLVTATGARVTEEATAPRSSLKAGVCVMANGGKNAKGVVAATRVSITSASKGSCTLLGTRSGRRPGSGKPPSGGFVRPKSSASFGFAFGQVTKIAGSTLTVKGPTGSTTVTLSAKTALTHLVTIKPSAITTKTCAFVRGTSTDKGVTVKATNVAITPERNGSCSSGFRVSGR